MSWRRQWDRGEHWPGQPGHRGGVVLGALVLGSAGSTVLTLVLAFAAAALLWLVVEEMLAEARGTAERPWMAVMFFGFLISYSLGVME